MKLRYLAEVNPAVPEVDRLGRDEILTFVPLEDVWPGRDWNPTQTRPKAHVEQGYTRFREGDVLLPKIHPTFQADRSTLATGLLNGLGVGTTELHVIRPRAGTDARYINYLLSTKPFLDVGEAEMIGVAGQKRVPTDFILDYQVPIVDVGEQRTIADYLDTETARIDALVAKKHELVNLARERVEALLEDLVWDSSQREVSLNRLVATFVDYRGATPEKSDSGVPLATAGHVKDGRLDLSTSPQFVAQSVYDSWMRRGFPELGDVLMTMEAPLGQVAQVDCLPIALAQRVILMKPETRFVSGDFLALLLRSPSFQGRLAATATGSTALGVRADRLQALHLPLVPRDRQEEVVQVVRSAESRIRDLGVALKSQIKLLREHRQALITAAVSGELEVSGVAA